MTSPTSKLGSSECPLILRQNTLVQLILFSEKKILISSSDTGKDLTSAHKLKKRHKRMEVEIASHQSNIDRILVSYPVDFMLNVEITTLAPQDACTAFAHSRRVAL